MEDFYREAVTSTEAGVRNRANWMDDVLQTSLATSNLLFTDSYDLSTSTATDNQTSRIDSNPLGTLDASTLTNTENSMLSSFLETDSGSGRSVDSLVLQQNSLALSNERLSEIGFPTLELSTGDDVRTALTDRLPVPQATTGTEDHDDDGSDEANAESEEFEFVAFTDDAPATRLTGSELANFYRSASGRFGSNGTVTMEHLTNALLDPNLSVQETGAIAALRSFLRDQPGQQISSTRMTELNRAIEARAADRAQPDGLRSDAAALENGTWIFTDRAAAFNMNLFANPTNPLASIVPEAAVQPRGVGNCHFISAMSAMASVNPEQLQNMIADNRNGTYTVTFPGMDPITVNAPTRGELLMYYDKTEHGTWPAVLTAAYGRYWTPGGTRNIEGANGSIRSDGLRTLTGGGIDTDDNAQTRFSVMNSSLEQVFRERRPVTAFISAELPFSDQLEDRTGLRARHEYAVIGYTPNADPNLAQITIRDPHGNVSWFRNGRPQTGAANTPPSGITDLGKGRFRMSLTEFNNTFTSLQYSEAAPRTQGR